MMGVIAKRFDLAQRFGSMFGGKRDFYRELGYANEVSFEAAMQKYKRQGIVSRIVNTYPDAVWSQPPIYIGNEKLDEALNGLFELGGKDNKKKKIKDGLAQTVGIYHYINRAERLAGLGKYSVMVLGFDDVKDTRSMARPVGGKPGPKPKGGNKTNLIYVQVYGYSSCKITKFTEDPSDENFGLPEIYTVQVKTSGGPRNAKGIDVHHTRILHIAEGLLDDEVEGYPIIERVYNELDDIIKVAGGGAEAAWQAFYKGLQFDLDKDMQFTEDDREKMVDEIEKYSHGLQRHIRTRGININELGADNIDPTGAFNVVVSLISTATGIPQRVFIGSEQGKLASEQDRSNLASRVRERRELHSEPRVLRPLISKLQFAGAVPNGAFEIDWPDPFNLSPLERGQTSAQQARSAVNIARTMKEIPDLLDGHEARDIIFARGGLKPRLSTQEREKNTEVEVPSDPPPQAEALPPKEDGKDKKKGKNKVDDKAKSE